MRIWTFYTIILFSAIMFVLGCLIWLITDSMLDATIVIVAVAAGLPFVVWLHVDESK
jgi:hypothetical protein